jgi:hypothetical protein
MTSSSSLSLWRCMFVLSLGVLLSTPSTAGDFSVGLTTGYKGGFTIRGNALIMNFAKGFPLGMEVGVGYTFLDPGDPAAARRVFVNNATNGTPEKSGYAWDFRLDFVYDLNLIRDASTAAFAGVRRSAFVGEFVFVGGNEDFEVRTNQWGIGAGVRGAFPMAGRMDFVLSAGVDYYINGTFEGHDASYAPDGQMVNQRGTYKYGDADAAINQPKLQPSVMIGLRLHL